MFLARFDFWEIDPPFAVTITSGVEVPVLSSIASGMMALTAIVFSLTFVFVANVLHVVGNAGRKVIESMYPLSADDSSPSKKNENLRPRTLPLPPVTQTLCYFGGPAVVVELHTHLLVALARMQDALIEIEYAVGDVVADGSAVLHVRGAKKQISEAALRSAIVLGLERTIEQDPQYALRLLVDVGIKALSPAVNDPTTAVMALNQIEDLVGRIGRRQLDVGSASDKSGTVRLVYPTPTWEDIVSLALDEIRFYGANSYQVMRRLRALLSDLEEIVLPERRAAIQQQKARLESTVRRTFGDAADLYETQQSDRQGIGLSRTVT